MKSKKSKNLKRYLDAVEMQIALEPQNKGTWGGKRERKTKAEATKVMRIPISKIQAVKDLLGKNKSD